MGQSHRGRTEGSALLDAIVALLISAVAFAAVLIAVAQSARVAAREETRTEALIEKENRRALEGLEVIDSGP